MRFHNRAIAYNNIRKSDSRLTNVLVDLANLKKGDVVADIGAGTGNYSIEFHRLGYNLIAVEPETDMWEQCNNKEIEWVKSTAEEMDLSNRTVDAAFVINAIHHFSNLERALQAMFRIIKSGTLLIFTLDPVIARQHWLYDYWPSIRQYHEEHYVCIEQLMEALEHLFASRVDSTVFEIPHDYKDVFSLAAWKTPRVLLDKKTRAAMSVFNYITQNDEENGVAKLRNDLTGEWEKKYSDILKKDSLDVGCRILRVKKEV